MDVASDIRDGNLSEFIEELVGEEEAARERYNDVARELGFDVYVLGDAAALMHPAILARARACKAAYDVVTKEVVQ